MPDFAPNFTARVKLTYSVFGDIHKCGIRIVASAAQSAAVAAAKSLLNDIFVAVQPHMTATIQLLDLEYSAANSTFFAPVSLTGLTATGDINAGVLEGDEIVQTTWSGRSIGGHKGKFVLFGLVWGIGHADVNDFVVTGTEKPAVATVAALLPSVPEHVMNDNQHAAFWRPRATTKQSDAWVAHRRP